MGNWCRTSTAVEYALHPLSAMSKVRSKHCARLIRGQTAFTCSIIGLITCLTGGLIPDSAVAISPQKQIGTTPRLSISYIDLLDKEAIVCTGQKLITELRDAEQKGAVQPFVDGYSRLLPAALEIVKGPGLNPSHNIVDLFALCERQPAWVAILRGGRIHITTDDKNNAQVFLIGDDPKQAYDQNYSVIRHCLGMLSLIAVGDLNVDVYAYHNDYTNSKLLLNTTPFSFHANTFETRKPAVDLAALDAFLNKGPVIQGAQIDKEKGLVLYGTQGPAQKLAGEPIALSDFAAAYRAVFHAGDNAAFISLDPNTDPTKTTVNFGGFLENTRIGSVVLEADKRFKTITSGLDPNDFTDKRKFTRQNIPSFLSGAERDFLLTTKQDDGQWIGTRFWYYPDSIEVVSDLNWTYAVITNPRFTADAERSRDDFGSSKEFERKKRNQMSPSIRSSIDNLNQHFDQYAHAFSELSELTTVARLMGICSWLYNTKQNRFDLDELLAVELPTCHTEVDRTQLMAATFFPHSPEEIPDSEHIAAQSKVVFLSPILDLTVRAFFQAPSNIVKYLRFAGEPAILAKSTFAEKANQLYVQYQNCKVRQMIHTKNELRGLADYAADIKIRVPPSSGAKDITGRITEDKAAIAKLKNDIANIKRRMDGSATATEYNALVAQHNKLVDDYEGIRERLNREIDQYNSQDIQTPYIVEIGGGINLDASNFAIRQNDANPNLTEFKNGTVKIGVQWTDIGKNEKWMKSESVAKEVPPGNPRANLNDRIAAAQKVQRWFKKDAQDDSWKSAIRLDANHAQEESFDAQQQVLQIAEFSDGKLHSLIVATREESGRIIFKNSTRRNVLPPLTPPVWWTP